MSEHSWYVGFWLVTGVAFVAPVYVMLYLILKAVSR